MLPRAGTNVTRWRGCGAGRLVDPPRPERGRGGLQPAAPGGLHAGLEPACRAEAPHQPGYLPAQVADRAAQLTGDGLVGPARREQPEDPPVLLGDRLVRRGRRVIFVPWHLIGVLPDPLKELDEPHEQPRVPDDQRALAAVVRVTRHHG